MNTSKLLVIAVAFSLGLARPCAVHGATTWLSLSLAVDAVGQTAKSKAASDRQEVDSLLGRARQAIQESNFETADSLISRAEKVKTEYSVFYLGDTPKKLRGELNAAQRASKRSGVERPSAKFAPELPTDKPAKQPAANQLAPSPPRLSQELRNPDDETPLNLPRPSGPILNVPPPQNIASTPDEDHAVNMPTAQPPRNQPVTMDTNPQTRRQSDAHLLAARKALADGDLRRATAALEAARKLHVAYGFHDDTPDKVNAAIGKYSQAAEAMKRQDSEAARHQLAEVLLDQAQQLTRLQEYDDAERIAQNAKNLRANFNPFELKPEALLERIATARHGGARAPRGREGQTVADRSPTPEKAANNPAAPYPTTQALYQNNRDKTRVRATGAQEEPSPGESEAVEAPAPLERLPAAVQSQPAESDGTALGLFREGEQALKDRDLTKALSSFRQAYEQRDQLDPVTARRLQDHLQMLSAPAAGGRSSGKPETLMDKATSQQQLAFKQLSLEISKKQMAAEKMKEKDPKQAMETLKDARATIEAAAIESDVRAPLLRRVDRGIAELEKYIKDNRAQIELDESNQGVLKEVERRQQTRVEVGEKLARLVDEYTKLMDQDRFAEAEVLAKRARELDPENPVVTQIINTQKFASRYRRNQSLREDKEDGAWLAWDSVEESAKPFDDRDPYRMPDAKKWSELTKSRQQQLAARRSRRTEAELDIERKLKTPVSCKFHDRPLIEVLQSLAKLAAVNLYLDPKGLEEEGVASDTPVTIDLTQDISLKSALNLILEPLHLSYVIKDEVLKITSEQLRDGQVYTQTYNVADLVIPIPNFVPNGRVGLPGAISDGYNMSGNGMSGLGSGMAFVASQDGAPASAMINPQVLAQMNQFLPGNASRMAAGTGQQVPFGPGGAGGGAQADFDSLIDLITNTVKPQTWDEVGGPGSVQSFSNNLSLVISQTQDVHEEIVDLLEQLRRNQDLQVTIEVRFITLNDNFFERIGVDFQANIVNNAPRNPVGPGGQEIAGNKKEIVGLNLVGGNAPSGDAPSFTPRLDIPFRQSTFNLATPQFGQPVEVAHFGFAILSDLEAFLLIEAAQGDRRSNVLQAPKVTMFNGQQASVFDQTQTPFVISVIPIVGDFAAAYQPVITVLSEGTALTVQAVISNDRRFVRLTVVPFFSQIGDVQEFTFSGSKSTTKNTSKTNNPQGDTTASKDDATTTTDGITIQLPNFSFVTVNTTVSVPDGGTVLLGGIKRLSEGRNEFGVPILSKLPYINRLFKNVGIGRETQSLMMMVTPRIIIQEEEEERLGITAPE